MEKRYLLALLGLVLIAPAFAQQTELGIFPQNSDITLRQLCADCTYNNITSIVYPNSSVILSNINMTQAGTEFSYVLQGNYVTELGEYIVNGVGNLGATTTIWAYTFDVTYTGSSEPDGIVLVLGTFMFLIILGLWIYSIIYWIRKLHAVDVTLSDVVYNLIFYVIAVSAEHLNSTYFGISLAGEMLDLVVYVGAITNVILPFFALFITYMVSLFIRRRSIEYD